MNREAEGEFELIDDIVRILGPAKAPWLRVGPGDDAAVLRPPEGWELVSSIDSFVADIHFPACAAPELIAYRSMMASLSDLAAMGAEPAWALVALCLPDGERDRLTALARGIAAAARKAGILVVGGNLTRSASIVSSMSPMPCKRPANAGGDARLPADGWAEAAGGVADGDVRGLALTISAHGWAPSGTLLLRSGARPGDAICVSGALGGAARALATLNLAASQPGCLSPLERCYWRPQPPFALAARLRRHASSCIDLSDGLLQDLGHICRASGAGARLQSRLLPVAPGASLDDALGGGDDYRLCFTTADAGLQAEFPAIGEVTEELGLRLDGEPVAALGYRHFGGAAGAGP